MKPVMQTTFCNHNKGIHGNCFIACVASLCEVSLEECMHLTQSDENDNWYRRFADFIIAHGFTFSGGGWPSSSNLESYPGVDGYVIVEGESPRPDATEGHAMIYRYGKPAHDPHPGGEGLKTIENWYLIKSFSPEGKQE